MLLNSQQFFFKISYVTLFVLFFNIPKNCNGERGRNRVAPAPTAAIADKYSEANSNANSSQHDKALERTLARIRSHTEDGFNFHFYKRPMVAYGIDERIRKREIDLLYVVAAREFHYEGQGDVLRNKAKFTEWLLDLEKPNLIQVKDHLELDNYLGIEGNNCSEDKEWHKYVVLVHHLGKCRDFLINNIARSFHGDPNVTTIEMVRPLITQTEAVLNWRLIGLSKKCRMIIVIHNSAFVEVENDISPAQLYQFTKSWSNQGNCSHPAPNVVRAPLNEIQIQYFSDEISIKQIEYNRVYILVGTIGGIAVVALAISIFWGLNGTSFVSKQS